VSFARLAYAVRRQLCVPDVIVDFVRDGEKLFVTVENIGDGPAHHVSATFDPKLRGIRGTVAVSELPLFQNLAFLAPGRELRTFLDASAAYFDRQEPTTVTATIAFENDGGEQFTRTITHNLSIYKGDGPPHDS
jgi:hypothetical protein